MEQKNLRTPPKHTYIYIIIYILYTLIYPYIPLYTLYTPISPIAWRLSLQCSCSSSSSSSSRSRSSSSISSSNKSSGSGGWPPGPPRESARIAGTAPFPKIAPARNPAQIPPPGARKKSSSSCPVCVQCVCVCPVVQCVSSGVYRNLMKINEIL
jgi:hypothetical protein